MDKAKLRSYAALIARMGVNVQPGQEVVIRTAPEQLEFVEMLVEECYLAGAAKVFLEWRFEAAQRLDIKYQSQDVLGRVEAWEEQRLAGRVKSLPANIYLDSDDPDGLAGVDHDKWAQAQRQRFKVTKPYRDAMENKYQWCVAAVPGLNWARKVFPGLGDAAAVERLWEEILRCSRADGDAMAAWRAHNARLKERCRWLNSLSLRRLIYKSESTGTDFTVGLIDKMRFMGASEELAGTDISFNANIPSEEVFTTPMRGDAEGVVYATRPLSYRGVLIEDFYIRFSGGRAVEAHAGKNEDALHLMLSMDDGASMLGEVELVPKQSPINRSGLLFYNTLFDENACCHVAVGMGFDDVIEGFIDMSDEEIYALGVNDSIIHVDFMVGSEDLDITGYREDGTAVPVFRNGTWAN